MTDDQQPAEPRIFIEVLRPIGNGQYARSRKEISLMEWEHTRHGGTLAEIAINAALAELSYRPEASPNRHPAS